MSSRREISRGPPHNEASAPSGSNHKSEDDLRGREMSEDPMLEYFRQKEREKQGKQADRPKYRGQYPVNRYNIRPGYRWDGVNRSNGFEKRLIDKDNERRAGEEERYRSATHDL